MSAPVPRATLTVPVGPDDWADGPADAPVTFVEYGDFECPHCAEMEAALRELRRLAGPGMRFVFRHFPLTSSHPHAEIAAEAAEAAGAQGAFWPMHDLLLANQHALTPSDLAAYAEALQLDVGSFVEALERHTYEPEVKADFMSGVRGGVSGTPSFYINGVRYDGAYDLDSLARAVQKAARASR